MPIPGDYPKCRSQVPIPSADPRHQVQVPSIRQGKSKTQDQTICLPTLLVFCGSFVFLFFTTNPLGPFQRNVGFWYGSPSSRTKPYPAVQTTGFCVVTVVFVLVLFCCPHSPLFSHKSNNNTQNNQKARHDARESQWLRHETISLVLSCLGSCLVLGRSK